MYRQFQHSISALRWQDNNGTAMLLTQLVYVTAHYSYGTLKNNGSSVTYPEGSGTANISFSFNVPYDGLLHKFRLSCGLEYTDFVNIARVQVSHKIKLPDYQHDRSRRKP